LIGFCEQPGKICITTFDASGKDINPLNCIDALDLDIIVPFTAIDQVGKRFFITSLNGTGHPSINIFDSTNAQFLSQMGLTDKEGKMSFLLYGIQYIPKTNHVVGISQANQLSVMNVNLENGVGEVVSQLPSGYISVTSVAFDSKKNIYYSLHPVIGGYDLCVTTLNNAVVKCNNKLPQFTELLTVDTNTGILYGENGYNITIIDPLSGKITNLAPFPKFQCGVSASIDFTENKFYMWVYQCLDNNEFAIFNIKQNKFELFKEYEDYYFFGLQLQD